MRSFAARHSVDLSAEDIDFAYQWTGGHPGYLAGVSRIVAMRWRRSIRAVMARWIALSYIAA